MYCSKCGESNEGAAKFCIKCGAQILVLGQPGAKPAPSSPVPGAWQGPATPLRAGAEQAGRKTSPGSWVSMGAAIVILPLFYARWASAAYGWPVRSGLSLVKGGEHWLALAPICAVAALGILYLFRKQLVVSAWARIAAAIVGPIPLIVLYIDYQQYIVIYWGFVGTVAAFAALIVGSVLDLLSGSRTEPK